MDQERSPTSYMSMLAKLLCEPTFATSAMVRAVVEQPAWHPRVHNLYLASIRNRQVQIRDRKHVNIIRLHGREEHRWLTVDEVVSTWPRIVLELLTNWPLSRWYLAIQCLIARFRHMPVMLCLTMPRDCLMHSNRVCGNMNQCGGKRYYVALSAADGPMAWCRV